MSSRNSRRQISISFVLLRILIQKDFKKGSVAIGGQKHLNDRLLLFKGRNCPIKTTELGI